MPEIKGTIKPLADHLARRKESFGRDSPINGSEREDDSSYIESDGSEKEGPESIIDYHKKSRTVKKTNNKEIRLPESNPMLSYLSKVVEEPVLPRGLNFVNRKGGLKDINLTSFFVNDRYAEAVASGLKSIKNLRRLSLIRANLTNTGLISIIRGLSQKLQALDISGNKKLTSKSISFLMEYIDEP